MKKKKKKRKEEEEKEKRSHTMSTGCGALYTDETGMLQSDNYPMSYPRNLNCLYVIRPANEQQLYKLVFTNFSTEACCDTVQVGNRLLNWPLHRPAVTKLRHNAAC